MYYIYRFTRGVFTIKAGGTASLSKVLRGDSIHLCGANRVFHRVPATRFSPSHSLLLSLRSLLPFYCAPFSSHSFYYLIPSFLLSLAHGAVNLNNSRRLCTKNNQLNQRSRERCAISYTLGVDFNANPFTGHSRLIHLLAGFVRFSLRRARLYLDVDGVARLAYFTSFPHIPPP